MLLKLRVTMTDHSGVESPSHNGFTVAGLLGSGGLRAVYQPIVDLETGRVAGYEALARGPVGSRLEAPSDLFAAARVEGLEGELDRACREVALDGAVAAGMSSAGLLFLNAEPGGLDESGALGRLGEGGSERVSVVVELTERALATRPAEVLAAVRWLRERGCRVALDDVGVDPRSLALMPFVAPDVVKLDIALIQDRLDPIATARVLSAVGAEAERSGAALVAEGIETQEHLERARAVGASMGQGWLFGRPGEIERAVSPAGRLRLPRRYPAVAALGTPFGRIADARAMRVGDEKLLQAMSHQLEGEALVQRGEAVVLANFQDARYFTGATRRRYERLSESAALVGATGAGISTRPGGAVRGASLDSEDPLRSEWDVVVVTPHFAAAFVARELQGERSGRRVFEYFATHDRALAIEAARPLLRRIVRTH